jgi:hypothetical protein
MLDSREIEELAAEDPEVLGMWGKATLTARTALVRALNDDPDARFTLLYQSALQAATAVVRAATAMLLQAALSWLRARRPSLSSRVIDPPDFPQ